MWVKSKAWDIKKRFKSTHRGDDTMKKEKKNEEDDMDEYAKYAVVVVGDEDIGKIRKLLKIREGPVVWWSALSEEGKRELIKEFLNIVKDEKEEEKVRRKALSFIDNGLIFGIGWDIIKDEDIDYIEGLLERGSKKIKREAFFVLLEFMKHGKITDSVVKGFVHACKDEDLDWENRETALRVVKKWIEEDRDLKGISDFDILYILSQ